MIKYALKKSIKETTLDAFFNQFEVVEKVTVNPTMDYSVAIESANSRARILMGSLLEQYPLSEIIVNLNIFSFLKVNDEAYIKVEHLTEVIKKLLNKQTQ